MAIIRSGGDSLTGRGHVRIAVNVASIRSLISAPGSRTDIRPNGKYSVEQSELTAIGRLGDTGYVFPEMYYRLPFIAQNRNLLRKCSPTGPTTQKAQMARYCRALLGGISLFGLQRLSFLPLEPLSAVHLLDCQLL